MKLYNLNVKFNFDVAQIRTLNWRPLFIGFLVGCFAALITQLGWVPQSLLSPLPSAYEIFDRIKPKLQERVNYFKLKRDRSILPTVEASFFYNEAPAYAAVDLDTGEVLVEKNASKSLPIASLTKIMSAVIALDLAQPDDTFTVSSNAQSQIPTKLGLKTGQKLTLYELLHATLLTSANDAAEVIREGIDNQYGENVFIDAMNEKAKFIGLKNTKFSNPQGFDSPNNYSSVDDVAVLSAYALTNYPLIKEIVKKDYQYFPENSYHGQIDLYNWNGLVGVYPNVFGVKIGNTDDAGVTISVASERQGKEIAVVILGAPDIKKRDLWAAELFDVAFEKTLGLPPVEVTEEELTVKYSTWKYW